jgi:hypothetical protein
MNDIAHKGHIRNIAIGTVAILMIPVIGMLVSDGWNWGPLDFVIMGALIFGTGLAYELTSRRLKSSTSRIFAGLGFFLGLLVIWVELATDGISRALGL